jgi:hypothetical protein
VLAVVIAVIPPLYLVTWSNRTELRKDYDERDQKIQTLEDRVASAEADAARLKEAEYTIAQQQKAIDQLRQQLQLPAPQPTPQQKRSTVAFPIRFFKIFLRWGKKAGFGPDPTRTAI